MTQPLRLFLVEDQEDVAFVVRKHLERAKYEVTVCRTGTDALIVLGNSPFDIVLFARLPCLLPTCTGWTLIQAVAREGINTPVVLMTGVGDEKLAAKAML